MNQLRSNLLKLSLLFLLSSLFACSKDNDYLPKTQKTSSPKSISSGPESEDWMDYGFGRVMQSLFKSSTTENENGTSSTHGPYNFFGEKYYTGYYQWTFLRGGFGEWSWVSSEEGTFYFMESRSPKCYWRSAKHSSHHQVGAILGGTVDCTSFDINFGSMGSEAFFSWPGYAQIAIQLKFSMKYSPLYPDFPMSWSKSYSVTHVTSPMNDPYTSTIFSQ